MLTLKQSNMSLALKCPMNDNVRLISGPVPLIEVHLLTLCCLIDEWAPTPAHLKGQTKPMPTFSPPSPREAHVDPN